MVAGAAAQHARPEPENPALQQLRLSAPGALLIKQGVVPEPTYGDRPTTRAIQGVKPEGRVEIRSQASLHCRFADGNAARSRNPFTP
jgi:CxxC motif-containing protein (DUF1111 family)